MRTGTFIKFGKEEHLKELFQYGTIYMKSIDDFRKIEDNMLRGDIYEGISEIKNLPPGIFEIPTLAYKGNYINIHYKISYETVYGNIYSMYFLEINESKDGILGVDKRVFDFGSHFLFILNVQEFLNRIERKIRKMGYKFYLGHVKYYDSHNTSSKISVFQKRIQYEYQKEFRIFVDRKSVSPLKFRIGDLTDIAEIRSCKELMNT